MACKAKGFCPKGELSKKSDTIINLTFEDSLENTSSNEDSILQLDSISESQESKSSEE